MADVDVKIEGLDEVLRKMDLLKDPRKIRNAAMRASRKAMNVVRDAARQNAKAIDDPETVEKIWKNIKVSSGKSRDKSLVIMRVGVDGGAAMNAHSDHAALAAKSGGNTTYWRFLEYGTSEIPAVPFMRPALANNVQKVTDTFSQSFNAELEKELSKL
ncbi:HK97-gp10 family putative phage morphogenesis protein [Acinetobacter lactucae]|uniref:HK97-gp10 family putative phage morphogenesis protein n=1 Tax=Acinetobacter lactucae TaxID=1785128 RepID=UPI0015804FD7|nr:HK97-gp10 family putative phage morphogenesis protein [Acinetobacter lactucae]NUG49652.1 HK97 gp10 family phage protein [Acinetobacter lactucae]